MPSVFDSPSFHAWMWWTISIVLLVLIIVWQCSPYATSCGCGNINLNFLQDYRQISKQYRFTTELFSGLFARGPDQCIKEESLDLSEVIVWKIGIYPQKRGGYIGVVFPVRIRILPQSALQSKFSDNSPKMLCLRQRINSDLCLEPVLNNQPAQWYLRLANEGLVVQLSQKILGLYAFCGNTTLTLLVWNYP